MRFEISVSDGLEKGTVADKAMKEFCADLKNLVETGKYDTPENLGIITVMTVDRGYAGRIYWDEHVTVSNDGSKASVYVFTDIKAFRAATSVEKIELIANSVRTGMKMLAEEYPLFKADLFQKDFSAMMNINKEKYEITAASTRRGRPRKNA